MKQYKEANPIRYEQIEKENKAWQIAQAEKGTAYFIVKAPHSTRLVVRINQREEGNLETKIISILDLLEKMQVDEDTKRVPLPSNWKQLSEDAIKTYNQ